MSSAMPAVVRACGRIGTRALVSGALAIGLLATAPTLDAHAATGSSTAASAKQRLVSSQTTERRRHHPVNRVARGMRIAAAQKGDPYQYGAAGPGRFDCSGLTYYSFRRAGFGGIPRTSSAQSHWARHIKRSNMRRGDLMFFTGGGGVYHVGVFAGWSHGRRLVLHAPHTGARVRVDRIWTNAWFPGTLRGR